jgi:hypothetical protein
LRAFFEVWPRLRRVFGFRVFFFYGTNAAQRRPAGQGAQEETAVEKTLRARKTAAPGRRRPAAAQACACAAAAENQAAALGASTTWRRVRQRSVKLVSAAVAVALTRPRAPWSSLGAVAGGAVVAGCALGHAGPAEDVGAVILARLVVGRAGAGGAVGAGREGHGVDAAGRAGGVANQVLEEPVGACSADNRAVRQVRDVGEAGRAAAGGEALCDDEAGARRACRERAGSIHEREAWLADAGGGVGGGGLERGAVWPEDGGAGGAGSITGCILIVT